MAGGYDTLTFMSDYGRTDEFVGVVHSVVRSMAPHVSVVDLTHDVAAYDVRAGGMILARSAQYLCPGVVLAVVDPGVATQRRAVAVEVGDGMSVLVGPDNGLLAPAVAICGGASRAVEITSAEHRLESPGPTFAGRDVFAPAAAHLCSGTPLEELGPLVDPASLLPGVMPVSRLEDGELVGEILWVDTFGNAQLNIDPEDLDEAFGVDEPVEVVAGPVTRVAKRVSSYAEIGVGRIGLLVDSYGMLSLAVDRSSVADELGVSESAEVRLRPAEGDGSAVGVNVRMGSKRGES